MTTPYTSSQASATINSQDLTINALLSGYKWGGSTGSGATVSFSFPWSNGSSAVFSGPNGSAYSSNGEASATYYFGLNSIVQMSRILIFFKLLIVQQPSVTSDMHLPLHQKLPMNGDMLIIQIHITQMQAIFG